ncbi:MerR family DNA-binding protein [Thalassotalea fusca]
MALIALGQRAGLSLDEIGQMLTKKGADIDRDLLMKKADEFEQKIRELTAMRDGLRHAAKCTAPNHFECPKFMRLVSLAAKKKKITA